MKNIYLLLLIMIGATQSFAQGSNFVISYPIAFPMGDLGDYNQDVSFRGISIEFNKRQTPVLDIGLEVGWQVFYSKEPHTTYTDKTASISGVQYRYTNAVPILAGAKYYIQNEKIHPYVGIGVGTLYAERSTDFGLYNISIDAWQFCVRPEVGIKYGIDDDASAFIGAKYYAGFGTDDLDGQSYLSVNIGFMLRMGY